MLDQFAVASVLLNVLVGVVGRDTRTQILDSTAPEYLGVGQILSCQPNGNCEPACTGTLIGPSTIITAAHCARKIFRPLERCGLPHTMAGLRKSYQFVQGRVGPLMAENQKFQLVERVSFQDCFGSHKISGDVALMRLDRNSTMGFAELNVQPNELANDQTIRKVRLAGYPAEKELGTLWRTESRVKRVTSLTHNLGTLVYPADTSAGMSGSLVWGNPGREWVPVGIHKGGEDDKENWATRFSPELIRAVAKRSADWIY